MANSLDAITDESAITLRIAESACTKSGQARITPWISDGTPHQWTAPAGENTSYPKGVSASHVPDMWFDGSGAAVAECAGQATCSVVGATNDPGPGALTFYYTNQQSARLLFCHDHAWGVTRLNVYAGQAAGYLITDNTEQALTAPGGALDASDAALGLGIPLVIQDRTFVPSAAQLALQDPTWDSARWGSTGNFWYHHVYMPAQNPADPVGVSPYPALFTKALRQRLLRFRAGLCRFREHRIRLKNAYERQAGAVQPATNSKPRYLRAQLSPTPSRLE